jgi:PKD repeat protein
VATFNDGPDTSPVTDFTATTNWGDNSTSTSTSIIQPAGSGTQYVVTDSHTYPEEGPYTTKVTVSDLSLLGINFGSASGSASVADAALTAAPPQPAIPDATSGKSFTAEVATFTDANAGALVGDYTASINWGDNTSSSGTVTQPGGAGTTLDVSGTHTYASNGTYNITVTVSDDGGSNVILTNTVKDYDAVITCSSSPCTEQRRPRRSRRGQAPPRPRAPSCWISTTPRRSERSAAATRSVMPRSTPPSFRAG